MFSGIVETTGIITAITEQQGCKTITLLPHIFLNDIAVGDSIAINGVCLTITQFKQNYLCATIVPQTLRLTNLSQLRVEDKVNMERSIKLNQRLGGHYVQGHVDGVGEILSLTRDHSDALIAKIQLPDNLNKYIVKKGYIAIDGMSITVIDVTPTYFTVTLIPHTQQNTIVKYYQKRTLVNLEVDILSKYVENFMRAHMP